MNDSERVFYFQRAEKMYRVEGAVQGRGDDEGGSPNIYETRP